MSTRRLSALALRLSGLLLLAGFAAWSRNPLVRLEALCGLSPSASEKILGLKGPFSGMTEGMHRLVLGDLRGAIASNVFTPVFGGLIAALVLSGRRPRVRSRADEVAFFACVLLATVVVNLLN